MDTRNIKELSLQAMREEHPPLPLSLARWVGYLLNRAGQLNREYSERLIEPLGLTARHYTVLALLGEAQPLAQIEMAARLRLDKNTIVILLNDLDRAGLVERRQDERDKRAHAVFLTDAGHALLSQATELIEQSDAELLALLTPEEQVVLRQILLRLV